MPVLLARLITSRATAAPADGPPQKTDGGTVPIAVVIVLTVLAFLGFFFLARILPRDGSRGVRTLPLAPRSRSKPAVLLSQEAVDGICTLKYGASPWHKTSFSPPVDGHSTSAIRESQSCAVCTESFKYGTQLRQLPCAHVFHITCIDRWLTRSAVTCPLWYVPQRPLHPHVRRTNEALFVALHTAGLTFKSHSPPSVRSPFDRLQCWVLSLHCTWERELSVHHGQGPHTV